MNHIKLFKPVVMIGILLTLMILTTSACTNNRVIKASLGNEFSVAIGQTAKISDDYLEIKLTDVINDSRCPQGVTCVWAGEVTCVLDITLNGKTESYQLVVSGAGSVGGKTYQNYHLYGNVEPYPKQGVAITKTDYRMKMTVRKYAPD